MKERSDSGPDNKYADIFIQLRHHLRQSYPEILTSDDREFQSPVSGLGKTFAVLEEELNDYKYKVKLVLTTRNELFDKGLNYLILDLTRVYYYIFSSPTTYFFLFTDFTRALGFLW